MNSLINISFTLFCFYLVYCLTLFLLQRRIIYPRYLVNVPDEGMMKPFPDIEKIWLNTLHGKVETWFLPPVSCESKDPAPAVIFAHGNGELIDFWPDELRGFARLGIAVLLVEYPGYGRSEGSPSQKSITETFIKAYDYLISREDIDASRIILLGRSLGGGAVCALAAQRPSAALILLSTFTSTRAFTAKFLVPGFIVRDPFDNQDIVAAYTGPVLIIHGRRDDIVPYKQGISLYQAAKNGKLITYDCRHNDCPPNWDIFWQDVAAFLKGSGIIEGLNE